MLEIFIESRVMDVAKVVSLAVSAPEYGYILIK